MKTDPYLFLSIFAGVALVFPLMPLALAWIAAARVNRIHRKPYKLKDKGGSHAKANCDCVLVDGGRLRVFIRHGSVCCPPDLTR